MSIAFDPKTTALVVIDLQNGIVGRPDAAPYSPQKVIENARKLADGLRAKGTTIVWVHVKLDETLRLPVDQPMNSGPTPPPPSAWELVPGIGVQPSDVVILKRQWGAFYGTNLEQQLRRRGIRTIVMAGIATNIGVESTARAAYDQGYELIFAEDAMTSVAKEAHAFATSVIFPRMGRVRTTDEIVEGAS